MLLKGDNNMKKHCLAASAVLCAVMMTACGAESEPPADTSAQTVSESTAELTSETESETTEAALDETSAEETSETAETSEEKDSFTCADIVADIENTVELPSMAEIGADRVHMYLDFEIPEGCDFAMSICGSGGFADEIFVIDASNIDEAALEAAVEKRIESREKDFEGYNPDEYDKLENYFSKYSNGYYMYVVTADNTACENIFDNYVK